MYYIQPKINWSLTSPFIVSNISGCAGVVIGHDYKSCGFARIGSNPTIHEKETRVVGLICVYVLTNIFEIKLVSLIDDA